MLFTDGISSIGSDLPENPLEVPVYCFCSDSKANFTLLKLWAKNSTGEFFNLTEIRVIRLFLSNSFFGVVLNIIKENKRSLYDFQTEIVQRLGKPSFGFLYAETSDVKDIISYESYPCTPISVIGGSFRFTGKLIAKPSGKMTIKLVIFLRNFLDFS